MQKAIEEAKRFVCTTKDRIVKDAKEFIQNVDWKKVAIGVAATAAITLAVVATGGAAAPVLIGAAVGAGISTGTTVVSGVIQGKSPAEIAQDASGAFMWGAIGGAVGGGTTQVLKNVGSKALGKVGKKVIENGVDMAVDLTQTATENGGLTGKDILFSAVTSFGGDIIGSVKTNSTTRNQLVDGVTDNKSVKNAVTDSVADSTDNAVKKSTKSQTVFKGQKVQKSDDLFDPNQVSSWKEKGKVVTGTNVERMESGRAPIGYDGKSVNLHHVDQTDTGGLIEISASEHQSRYSELHTNTGQAPSQINRNEFNSWKKQYWPDRANDFK